MAEFFAELKRRQMFRVAAAYAVVAWLILQVVNNLAPGLNLPSWAATLVIILLGAGFPVALLFCWIQQLAPADGAAAPPRTAKLDWLLIGALVLVLGLMSYQQLWPSSDATRQAGVDAARSASLNPRVGISLAVLPFANLSDDESQAFFSDGVTEEIITALARIPDLRVVARESASQFKGERRDLRAVAQALGATHLIEGSVRRAGTRVRITARLVQADDGVNAWVNSFDRELTDVFAIQEEIATSIAGALRMPLGLKPGEQLVSNRGIDPESYEQLLRAKALLATGRPGFARALEILEPLVVRNPDYAPAWANLAWGYGSAVAAPRNGSAEEVRRSIDMYRPKMEAAARRALALDPNSVDAYMLQAALHTGPRRLALLEDSLSQALALDPNHPNALERYSSMLLMVGRVKEALAMKQRLHALEPFVPAWEDNLANSLWLVGENEAAIAILRSNAGRPGAGRGSREDIARVYASLGRYEEASDAVSQILPNIGYPPDLMAAAARLLRSAPATVPAPETLPRLGSFGFVYLHLGAPARALEFYEECAKANTCTPIDIAFLWHPSYAPVRKMERFKTVVRDTGLLDYWRDRGWPSFCRPATGDDFECD